MCGYKFIKLKAKVNWVGGLTVKFLFSDSLTCLLDSRRDSKVCSKLKLTSVSKIVGGGR